MKEKVYIVTQGDYSDYYSCGKGERKENKK